MKKSTWTKNNLTDIVKTSFSYAECLRKMGLRTAGGNYRNLQDNILKYDLCILHFTGQQWNKNKEIILFENLKKPESIKARLIKECGHKCWSCKRSKWMGKPITLELEHIDGNRRNNERKNLSLLCPNCHSQTSTWKNRSR